jgi:hypothetical protein
MPLEVNMKEQTKRSSPKYTLEFKQDVAKLVNEKGYTHQQAADLPRKSSKVRIYPGATEDLPYNRVMPCNGGECQCLLFVGKEARIHGQDSAKGSA